MKIQEIVKEFDDPQNFRTLAHIGLPCHKLIQVSDKITYWNKI